MRELYIKIKKNKWTYPALFCLGFLVVLILHLFKAPLGIPSEDEAFYLTIPKRILDGDALLVDEWHGSQLSAILLFPFMSLHTLICGFDSILLHFRYIYIAVHALCAVIVYIRLRSFNLSGVLASLFFFLYTPYSIMALNYNSMGIMLVTLVGVLLATAKSQKVYYISGFLFAGSVLCCPYLILAYGLVTLVVWFCGWKQKNKGFLCAWGKFTLGAVLLAIPVVYFIFSKASLQEISNALPFIFSDPAHQSSSLLKFLGQYAHAFLCMPEKNNYYLLSSAFCCLAICIAILYAMWDKNRMRHRCFYFLFSITVSLIMLIRCVPFLLETSYNFIMLPLLYTGLMSYIVTEKRNHSVFLFLFCGGLLYTLCIHMSSNQGRYSISAAITVANIASILFIGSALREMVAESGGGGRPRWRSYILGLAVFLLFVTQFTLMGYVKVNHKISSNVNNNELTETLSQGPYSGIHVTAKDQDAYMRDFAVLQPLTKKEEQIFYEGTHPCFYLITPSLKIAAYSSATWWDTERAVIERLATYYTLNPDKVPNYICLPPKHSIDQNAFQKLILNPYGFCEDPLIDETTGWILYSR